MTAAARLAGFMLALAGIALTAWALGGDGWLVWVGLAVVIAGVLSCLRLGRET